MGCVRNIQYSIALIVASAAAGHSAEGGERARPSARLQRWQRSGLYCTVYFARTPFNYTPLPFRIEAPRRDSLVLLPRYPSNLSRHLGQQAIKLPQVPAQVAWITRKEHKGIASRRLNSERQSGGERGAEELVGWAGMQKEGFD
jgi:hypothetical protein